MKTTKDLMEQFEKILKAENSFVKSEIDGLSDLIWSMGVRTLYSGGQKLVEWFHLPVPAFGNRIPLNILKEDGEEALFKEMMRLPC